MSIEKQGFPKTKTHIADLPPGTIRRRLKGIAAALGFTAVGGVALSESSPTLMTDGSVSYEEPVDSSILDGKTQENLTRTPDQSIESPEQA